MLRFSAPLLAAAYGVSEPRLAASNARPPTRVLLTDVDGTLFPFGTRARLSSANAAALARALGAGVHVGLATGRIPGPWSDALCAELPGLGASVFANGCLVAEPRQLGGAVLLEHALPPAAVAAVAAHCAARERRDGARERLVALAATRWRDDGGEEGLRYVELAPDGARSWVSDLIRDAGEPETVRVRDFDAVEVALASRRVLKFVFFTRADTPGWAPMAPTVAALRAALAGTGASVLDCGPGQCEVLPPGVNKGSGVAALLEHLGVEPDAAVACGDAENDVEMLRLVGVGVAMGNAKPPALAAADVVVASNDDDGVAEAVRRFVFREEGE